MKISVVMASYLGYYQNAAKNRDVKIIRAIESVRAQTYTDWELLIIGDSCERTKQTIKHLVDDKIKFYNLKYKRSGLFQPFPRNAGIQLSTGELICYLDIDDLFFPNHLKNIVEQVNDDHDWYWFDDYVWNGSIDNDVYKIDNWNIQKRALEFTMCGTSNIAHKKRDKIYWFGSGYKHDWHFIINIMNKYPNYKYITGSEYMIAHMPGNGGYDV